MIEKAIEERTVNQLGISVGTALALESLFDIPKFDPEREIPNKVNPGDYKNHVYNILTLFRNVINSIQFTPKEQLISHKLVHEELLNDIYNIIQLYEQYNVNLKFYFPNYTVYNEKYNKYRKDPIYQPYIRYEYLRKYVKDLQYPKEHLIKTNSGLLSKLIDKTLILTHYTVDLLNIDIIPQLELLESHTGKIKKKNEWGTKYHPIGKRDLSILPFHRKLLAVLGDKTIIKPDELKRRREIYDYAVAHKWHPGMSKIKLEQELLDIII